MRLRSTNRKKEDTGTRKRKKKRGERRFKKSAEVVSLVFDVQLVG